MARQISFCVMIVFAAILMNIFVFYGFYGAYRNQEAKQHKLLFVFGDSIYDPGNNYYLTNRSKDTKGIEYPFGMSLHNHASGRVCDGLNVPDFIGLFMNKRVPPPFLQPGANFDDGVNFASSGARVLEEIRIDQGMNFKIQLSNFYETAKSIAQKVGDEEGRKLLMRSIYLLTIGSNDYFEFHLINPNASKSQKIKYMHKVVANLTNGFKKIYDKGGRKFAVQNIGPLGCYPKARQIYPELNGSCSNRLLTYARIHNKAMSDALKKLSSKLPGFKYSIFDHYNALIDRMHNSTKYGFKEGKIACCGYGMYKGNNCGGGERVHGNEPFDVCSHPDEYVLFDGAHTTMRANRQLAELIWNGKPNITGPYNVKQLFDFP